MTQTVKKTELNIAYEIKDILKDIMERGEKLRELSSTLPMIKDPVARGTHDIAELTLDMIYTLCDYIGAASDNHSKTLH